MPADVQLQAGPASQLTTRSEELVACVTQTALLAHRGRSPKCRNFEATLSPRLKELAVLSPLSEMWRQPEATGPCANSFGSDPYSALSRVKGHRPVQRRQPGAHID